MAIAKRGIASFFCQTSSAAEEEARGFEATVVFVFTEEGLETASHHRDVW